MTIKEFGEKYNIDKRRIDYLTNLDLLHPTSDGYKRHYDKKCEEEVKIIAICEAAGLDTKEIKSWQTALISGHFDKVSSSMKNYFRTLIDAEKEKAIKKYDLAKQILNDL